MIPLSTLLKNARLAFPQEVAFKYSHPNLYLMCTAEVFQNLTQEARLEKFAKALALEPSDVEMTVSAGLLQLVLVTAEERDRDYEFLNDANGGHHWIEFMACPSLGCQNPVKGESPLTSLHFYGFKGGQGRSTVLALLAKQLADDGYRVLAVDADLEAPSLDLLLGATASAPSSTLLGYNVRLGNFRPLSAYSPREGVGIVDLIPCRPDGEVYDLDFAAFVLRSSLDVLLPEEIATKLREHAINQRYDVIIFDHRSGLAAPILPMMAACPGPVAICLRLDDQSSRATSFFEILLRQNAEYPGLFVSFSLDPDETVERMRARDPVQIETLLSCLSDALARGADDPGGEGQLQLPLEPDDLSDYWVPWFHDRVLLGDGLPAVSELSKRNLESLQRIRNVIGLATKKPTDKRTSGVPESPGLSASGGTDEGLFIETEALRQLLHPNTPFTYIFGRKGTGKTRLLRELATRGQGEPLVVASDFKGEAGIPSSDPSFKDLSDEFIDDPEKFWWAILGAGLNLPGPANRDALLNSLKQIAVRTRLHGPGSVKVTDIVENAARQSVHRVFLVDGIETAFLSSRLIQFLEGLFKFLSSIQNNPKLQDRVTLRLFLRTDLARHAFQNIEQQISSRVIYLRWDTQTILNFVLSRITLLPWFKQTFSSTVSELEELRHALVSGNLPVEECDRLLSQVFPQKIRRNNLLTLTFLKTYFSGSAGEAATYYPRIYDRFLHLIDNPSDLRRQFSQLRKLEEGRVSQALIFAAHEQAAKDYLEQVEAELIFLLQLAPEHSANAQRVRELLQAFAGLSTPFLFETCLEELCSKLQAITESQMRAALLQMREVGIFEGRPGFPNHWRVGRLFKASLGMKYVRSQRVPENGT